MTSEVNAAVEGWVRAGASEVVVADSHWNFRNLILDELHEAATVVSGRPRPLAMVQGLDATFDAALFVGYHGMRATPHSVLEHTFSGDRVQRVEISGRPVGELGLNAYLAGHHGVPVVLVTSDATVAAEARATIPGVHTVAVKEGLGRYSARNMPVKRARQAILAEAVSAVEERRVIPPLRPSTPVTIEVEFSNAGHGDLAEMMPGVKRTGGKVVEFTSGDFAEAYRTFVGLLMLTRD